MEFTIPFPCIHLSPSSITLNLELSIIMGTLEISGSEPTKFKNLFMQASPSKRASSKLMSIILAPFSTCCLATLRAVSKSSSFISLANLGDPVTLVRSPTMIKGEFSPMLRASSPLNLVASAIFGMGLRVSFSIFFTKAAI